MVGNWTMTRRFMSQEVHIGRNFDHVIRQFVARTPQWSEI